MHKNLAQIAGLLVIWGVCLLVMSGCGPANEGESLEISSLDGRIMLWHSWPEAEGQALQAQVEAFERLHPEVRVVTAGLSAEEILQRYQDTASLGLGPDLLLGSSRWLPELQANETIQPVPNPDFDFGRFFPAALQLVTVEERVWAVPITLNPPALFFNTGLAVETPRSFDELLVLADNEQAVALNTGSFDAYYGIQAFGNPLVTQMNDALILNLDGLIGWLAWLKSAQTNPNVILSQDQETLSRLFDRGDIAFTISSFEQRQRFEDALSGKNENSLGIAPLPSGPIGPARPLLTAEVLFFNRASSDRQTRLAVELARFLSNAEQNNALMREVNLVPANQRVRVNSRAYPDISAFIQSGRTATSLPAAVNDAIINSLDDSVYTAVLTGVEEPEAAACSWQARFIQEAPTAVQGDPRCEEK